MYDKVAIICTGTEISYGMNLIHLIKYEDQDVCIKCHNYDGVDFEIYSIRVFEKKKISTNTLKIFIGTAAKQTGNLIFDKYGMYIRKDDDVITCSVDINKLDKYSEFIEYANDQRDKYLNSEKDYIQSVCSLNSDYIVQKFATINGQGLFMNNRIQKLKIQQLYDCMAFILFNEIIKK